MNKKHWITALAGLALAGSVAIAQPPRGGQGERARGGEQRFRVPGGERLFEFLGLTAEQQAEWRAAHEAQRDSTRPLVEALRANRESLREAIDAEDVQRIGELTLEGERLRAEMKAGVEALQAELASILDAEQLEKWEAFRAARGDGPRFERRGPRGHRGRRGPGAGA